jgi:hypothetical protein
VGVVGCGRGRRGVDQRYSREEEKKKKEGKKKRPEKKEEEKRNGRRREMVGSWLGVGGRLGVEGERLKVNLRLAVLGLGLSKGQGVRLFYIYKLVVVIPVINRFLRSKNRKLQPGSWLPSCGYFRFFGFLVSWFFRLAVIGSYRLFSVNNRLACTPLL